MNFSWDDPQIVFSLSLFVATLVVIFVTRAIDRKNTKLGNVKKFVERYQSELERNSQSFRQESTEVESQIAKKSSEVKTLITTLNEQIKDVTSYSDDMARLRSAMKSFHDALDGLGRLSIDADKKVEEVTQDTTRLEEVRKDIEQFRTFMQDAEASLVKHQETVSQLEASSLSKLENAVSAADIKQKEVIEQTTSETDRIADEKINLVESSLETLRNATEKALASIEERLATFKEVSDILAKDGKEILSSICERSSQMLLASETVESLANQKEKLEKEIAEFAEQRKVEEENIALARAERQRLTSLNNAFEPAVEQPVIEEPAQEPVAEPKKVEPAEEKPVETKQEIEIEDIPLFGDFSEPEEKEEEPKESDVKKEYYGKEETVEF